MRVQDVMTEDVQTISPGNAAEEAWELMRKRGFHHVVVTRGSSVVGILSDRDAGGRLGSAVRRGHTVEELMTGATRPPAYGEAANHSIGERP